MDSLTAADAVELNQRLCADTAENHALLDSNGLEAAMARPWSGFGDLEAFPTIYDKAGSLLHGLASRQVFENGNKRTAWAVAATFLEVNGVDIGAVKPSHSDMFVRAAGLDHSLEVADLAEWFRVTHEAAVGSPAVRLTSLMLVNAVDVQNDMVYVLGGALTHYRVPHLPVQLAVLALLVFQGEQHGLVPALDIRVEVSAPGQEPVTEPLTISLPFGSQFDDGFPVVVPIGMQIALQIVETGRCELRVITASGSLMGVLPFVVNVAGDDQVHDES